MRSLVDERKLYQIFLGAKLSIQEFTLGPKVAQEMRYAYELAQKELFPTSQTSERPDEKLSTGPQNDGQTGQEETNEEDESSPDALSKDQLRGLLNDFLDQLIASKPPVPANGPEFSSAEALLDRMTEAEGITKLGGTDDVLVVDQSMWAKMTETEQENYFHDLLRSGKNFTLNGVRYVHDSNPGPVSWTSGGSSGEQPNR
jgi:hypothetical protein